MANAKQRRITRNHQMKGYIFPVPDKTYTYCVCSGIFTHISFFTFFIFFRKHLQFYRNRNEPLSEHPYATHSNKNILFQFQVCVSFFFGFQFCSLFHFSLSFSRYKVKYDYLYTSGLPLTNTDTHENLFSNLKCGGFGGDDAII